MTFSKFEKYAAGQINNHSSQVDVEGLWNDILPHVQNDNRRKRGLIWFFFAGLLLSLAMIFALNGSNPSGAENEIATLSSAEFVLENKDSESNKNIEKEIIATPNSESENSNPNAQAFQISNKNERPSQTISNKKADNQKYKATTTKTQTNNSKTDEYAVNSDIDNTSENAEKNTANLLIAAEALDTISKASNAKKEEATPTDTENSKTEIDTIDLAETANPEEEIADDDLEEEEDKLPPRRKGLKMKYGVGVYGGISSSFASLKDKDGMNPDYLQLRLGTEEQLETTQMGLDVVARSKYGVYLKTGVQYSRIARKFSLNSSITIIDSVDGIQKIYVNSNTNDTIYIYGPVPVTTTTAYNKVTYNYFHLMDIPLLLGYSYNNENWSFGVEAGALFNISAKTKGEIMQNDVDIYDMKEDPLNWFTDNVGVSFLTSISIAYQLDDNFQIYIAPTARLESVFSTDANPIAQKHGSLGINAGVRYFIGF